MGHGGWTRYNKDCQLEERSKLEVSEDIPVHAHVICKIIWSLLRAHILLDGSYYYIDTHSALSINGAEPWQGWSVLYSLPPLLRVTTVLWIQVLRDQQGTFVKFHLRLAIV